MRTETINVTADDFEVVAKGAKCKKLSYLSFNRQFTERKKFKQLKASLDKLWKNLIPIVVADIDGEYYLVDGQGRLACIYSLIEGTKKSFPITLAIDDEVKSVDDLLEIVVDVNNTNTPWDTIDYLKARVCMEQSKSITPGAEKYEILLDLIEDEFADIAYKTAIDVLGVDKNKVLEDLESEWRERFDIGKKVLNVCKTFPVEDLRTNNKLIKSVDYISRNVDDISLDTIFDNITNKDKLDIISGTAESVLGVLLDCNDSNYVHKSRQIKSNVKREALMRADGKCEGMIRTARGSKRCAKKSPLHYHHDLAHSSNGSNDSVNVRILCARCNMVAQDTPVEFWDEQ